MLFDELDSLDVEIEHNRGKRKLMPGEREIQKVRYSLPPLLE